MEDLLNKIAMQGFGYVLFVLSCFVIGFLYKENKILAKEKVDLANQRVEDLKEARDAYSILSESSTKIAENTYIIVQNLQQLLNTWKKV